MKYNKLVNTQNIRILEGIVINVVQDDSHAFFVI